MSEPSTEKRPGLMSPLPVLELLAELPLAAHAVERVHRLEALISEPLGRPERMPPVDPVFDRAHTEHRRLGLGVDVVPRQAGLLASSAACYGRNSTPRPWSCAGAPSVKFAVSAPVTP